MFNIIARRTLNRYCELYPEATNALSKWYYEIEVADFSSFNELKQQYANASIVADDRVIFNIHGNKYRLIVRVNFTFKAIQIKWFGTHAEYDKVDAVTIQYEER